MAKLTRTQKFAELRDSLANDKEASLSTQELSNYENRLNNLTEHLSATETKKEEPVVKQEETPVSTGTNYSWTDFDETPIDDLLNSFKVNDPFLWNDLPEVQTVTPEEKKEETSDDWHFSDALNQEETQPAAENVQEEVRTETAAEEENPYVNYLNNIDPKIEAAYREVEEKEKETVTEEPQNKEIAELEEDAPLEAVSLDSVIDELPISKPLEEADNHVIEHEDHVNTYLNEMINEVSQYNKDNGENTISDLTDDMVNEVRHGDDETPVVIVGQDEETEDEEFSNTVSVEIAKIMDEVPSVEESKEAEVIEEPVLDAEPLTEEHPVLAKTLEEEQPEEEVVEIKNLKDIEAEPVRETTSNTIPFVVAASDDEDIIDEDEEEGSNAILNVILIVLIIILMVVLGLIVFYILKTKGIF